MVRLASERQHEASANIGDPLLLKRSRTTWRHDGEAGSLVLVKKEPPKEAKQNVLLEMTSGALVMWRGAVYALTANRKEKTAWLSTNFASTSCDLARWTSG